MKPDFLLEPVSDDSPCGPDLDAAGDNAYFDYVLPAESRLPARFVDAVKGELFDRQSIDLAAETKSVHALLGRTRDLRLLVLLTRFEALAGDFAAFSESLESIAALLDARWADVHPGSDGGDFTLRQVALEMLDDVATVSMPIVFAPLFKDRRIGAVSLHTHQLASGKSAALANETAFAAGDVIDALARGENADAIVAVHGRARRAVASLKRIRGLFLDHSEYDYAPGLDRTLETLGALVSLLESHCPALMATAPEETASPGQDPAEPNSAADVEQPVQATVAAKPSGPVRSPADVRAALESVENYFLAAEPSSLALVLVRQTKRLYGRPLVEALGELLPGGVDSASIGFDPKIGFRLDMTRMRALSADVAAPPSADGGASFPVASRSEALATMQAIEQFVKYAEPSSPTPILLSKARGYLDKDFAALVRDLFGGNDGK